MGSGLHENAPVHRVKISEGFWMGQTEVTQAQYVKIIGRHRSYFKGDDLPVTTMSWGDAVTFCRELSRREGLTYVLPTEAQWEYACRAGTDTLFNTGNTISTDLANHRNTLRNKTTPVGTFAPNQVRSLHIVAFALS